MVLYRGTFNPVTIFTGTEKNLRIIVQHGKIKTTGKPGKILLKPDDDNDSTILILTNDDATFRYAFVNRRLPLPDIELDNYSHNSIPGLAKGLVARVRSFDFDVSYMVDSFTVIREDSSGLSKHRNFGWKWDAITYEWYKKAKPGTTIRFEDIYVSRDGHRIRIPGHVSVYFPPLKN
jgi:hypothetical protein